MNRLGFVASLGAVTAVAALPLPAVEDAASLWNLPAGSIVTAMQQNAYIHVWYRSTEGPIQAMLLPNQPLEAARWYPACDTPPFVTWDDPTNQNTPGEGGESA